MEDVTHASPHANCRAPEVLWRWFVHPYRCLGQMLYKASFNLIFSGCLCVQELMSSSKMAMG